MLARLQGQLATERRVVATSDLDDVLAMAKALEEATHNVLRYYGKLWTEPGNLIHHGPASKIAEEIAGYADAGIDFLIVFPQIPSLDQVEQLAEHVLPAYR